MDKTYEIIVLFKEIKEAVKKTMVTSFKDVDITSSQWLVLGVLLKNGKMTMSKLSKYVGLSNSTVSGIVDRLERQGYVVRIRDEKDRRKVYVKVTDKFNEVAKKSHMSIEKSIEKKLKNISEEDINKVIEGLKILKKIFEEK
ncbi:MarR family winged helix-turn-helix transcriptional regulator [Marinitoga aeolica]|uniref:MarR family transcriptional regulator n=1 Tax=Marinitoga aeolica TaxID=2809031 RepID=A0ABY8PNH9_9BACT|nr:MarR family transcriptional regulator [Marinitoga aeolica]WGS64088.1 MarR family transcriptional regulator [Marinitoga aeolica]